MLFFRLIKMGVGRDLSLKAIQSNLPLQEELFGIMGYFGADLETSWGKDGTSLC